MEVQLFFPWCLKLGIIENPHLKLGPFKKLKTIWHLAIFINPRISCQGDKTILSINSFLRLYEGLFPYIKGRSTCFQGTLDLYCIFPFKRILFPPLCILTLFLSFPICMNAWKGEERFLALCKHQDHHGW